MASTRQDEGRIRIAICGGGIAGLCLAVCLTRHPHLKVDLYEAAGEFKEIGAGVTIWGRTWKLLERIGLTDELQQFCDHPPKEDVGVCFEFRRSDLSQDGTSFQVVKLPYGAINFYRADFLDVLVKHIPPGSAHFRKRLTKYTNKDDDGSVQLDFADGSQASCDILIGADGIKSTVRAQLYRDRFRLTQDEKCLEMAVPVWTGSVAFRGLVDVSKIPPEHRVRRTPVMYCGKDKHIVTYSINQGEVINIVAFASEPDKVGSAFEGDWVTESSQEELLECFKGWETEAISLLKAIEKPTKWAIHQLRHLPTYTDKSVLLIGDAAHAMCPHLGVGAGQAIEDAIVLSELLASANRNTLRDTLNAFESIRLPTVQAIAQASVESGAMFEFNGPQGDKLAELGTALQDLWLWMYHYRRFVSRL